jgi:ribulose 1,5-bisphosphate carboxylase large subunit-like protein
LSKQQKEVAFEIVKVIASNENPEAWDTVVDEYVKNPKDKNLDKISDIQTIAAEHGVDTYIASILYHSKDNSSKE